MPMAGESPDGEPVVFESEAAAIAALNHARTMLLCQVDVRVKNFNFFLVIVGALAVALRQWSDPTVRAALSFGGCLLALVFFLLDVRTLQLIKDSRHDLYALEPRFALTIHEADKISDPARGIESAGRSRFVSHTFCYRSVFAMAALLFLAVAIMPVLWARIAAACTTAGWS